MKEIHFMEINPFGNTNTGGLYGLVDFSSIQNSQSLVKVAGDWTLLRDK